MNNRLITPNKQLVDLTGSAVSSKKNLEVKFEKQTRIVLDRVKGRAAPVDFTHVSCDGRVCAWKMTVPMPPNIPNPHDLVVCGGIFVRLVKLLSQSGVPRAQAEASARLFALTCVENEINEKAAG